MGSMYLFGLILIGFLLRAALAILAERRLDCDESTVALMSLDILEQGARPMFFYGGSYNGGAAFEAYLGAGVVTLFGYSEIGFKLLAAFLWTGGALLFGDLCRRQLPRRQAFAAVAFLCLATPFFLEWSTNVRGGFSETLLFSALLLWLARPPEAWLRTPALQPCAFGIAAGLSLWASEMILPLLPLAALWLMLPVPAAHRSRTLVLGLCAFAVGLLPLVAYNFASDWQHLRESVVAGLFEPGGTPLSVEQLIASAHFVLGPAGWLLVAGVGIGAARSLLRPHRPISLSQLLLAHALVYGLAYWLSGVRFLEVPPSRVLYPLQLNLAVLLACAVDWGFTGNRISRGLTAAAVLVWLVASSIAVIPWLASGEPRASGSWRASWCLIDGSGLRAELERRDVDVVFVNYWTGVPLALANRVAVRQDPKARRIVPSTLLPERPKPGQRAAVALHHASPLLARLEQSLQRQGEAYQRWRWGSYQILSNLDASQLRAGTLKLPALLEEGSRPPPPASPDGFN